MIPWVGDIVQIEHHNHSNHSSLSSIIGDIVVQKSNILRSGHNLVRVVVSGFEVDIQIPRGNIYSGNIYSSSKIGPLFKLIKPVANSHDVHIGYFDPTPVPGDIIQLTDPITGPKKHTIEPCNCSVDEDHWPYGRMGCGAHMSGRESLAYTIRDGWLYTGLLFRNVTSSVISWTTSTLKNANTSPSSTLCVACGGPLKDIGMGPSYKHCPKCEP
jgi:hypothetical protein